MERLKILVVEDNLAHLRILQYVMQRNQVNANLFYARDGQDALNFLFKEDSYANNPDIPTPNLILLDLNLPKRDGREVLKIIKENNQLKEIPVVIVSTSDREEDITYAKTYGAAAYISKSVGFDNFNHQISQISKYANLK